MSFVTNAMPNTKCCSCPAMWQGDCSEKKKSDSVRTKFLQHRVVAVNGTVSPQISYIEILTPKVMVLELRFGKDN